MGSTTPSQGLRYPYVDDVISEAAQGNLGADVAAKLTTQDTARALVIQKPFIWLLPSATACADGVDTALVWSSVQFDTYSMWSAGTPTRITPGTGNVGLWKYSLSVAFSAGVGITRVQISIAVTGTTRAYRTAFCNSSVAPTCTLSGMQQISSGTDYIEFKVTHNGGGSQSPSCVAMLWQASA